MSRSDKPGVISGGRYNNWDAGYATMNTLADLLAPYIDSCVPADTARPYIEHGYTGWQAVPYIVYNMPMEAAAYFIKQGILADLCGPYFAVGVSREDTVAYLNSGYTADQIMPYIKAGVKESDTMAYLDAGYTYDKVGLFLNAGVPESDVKIFLGAGVTYDRARPYIGANISASAHGPVCCEHVLVWPVHALCRREHKHKQGEGFPTPNIPSDPAIVYINNGTMAMTAKPYVDAEFRPIKR